jgi:ribonuclease-3
MTKRTTTDKPIHPQPLEKLNELEEKIGHRFRKRSLLRTALVHTSYLNESGGKVQEDNERLEFVGDAVLEFIVSEYLYKEYPGDFEGALTVRRSSVVGRKQCAAMARRLRLEDFVLVGKGERSQAGGVKQSILANAFEAIIAGLYLDGGMRAARRFVLNMLRESTPEEAMANENYKARLQVLCQKEGRGLPSYRVVSSEGPEHAKTFNVEVVVNGVPFGKGKGATKKEAEQGAARNALGKIGKATLP